MASELKSYYSYRELAQLFEEGIEKAEELKRNSEELLTVKPDESSWSVCEIIQHLVKFNHLYLSFIDKAIARSDSPVTGKKLFRARLFFRWYIRLLMPPYKMKVKTLSPLKPSGTENLDCYAELDRLIQTNREMIERIKIAEAEKLDLNRIKGKNSVLKISMTLSDFILIWDAHQKRHFWQAEKTLETTARLAYN